MSQSFPWGINGPVYEGGVDDEGRPHAARGAVGFIDASRIFGQWCHGEPVGEHRHLSILGESTLLDEIQTLALLNAHLANLAER